MGKKKKQHQKKPPHFGSRVIFSFLCMKAVQKCLGMVMLDILGEQINGQHAGEAVRAVINGCGARL